MEDSAMLPINLSHWIEENRHLLKPPVGNKMIWKNHEFIVMVVGGPNARADYHINEGEEFFYQLEGEMVLRIRENGKPKDIPIKAGEVFLLPAQVPHSPRRKPGSIGLVIERHPRSGEKSGFLFFCEACDAPLHQEEITLQNIEADLPPVFQRFFGNEELCTCKSCGKKHVRESFLLKD